MKKIKVLNLFAGIGANRKLWKNVEVTAVELNPEIAAIYLDLFPGDTVVVTDAHQYLLEHYKEFDFIWASYPCQSHSRARFWVHKDNPVYPDMSLYQGVLLLQNFFKGLWVVENVNPFYSPLIEPSKKLGRHLFWSNFLIKMPYLKEADIQAGNISEWQKLHGIDISKYKLSTRRDQVLRNCVHPETGLAILNSALGIIEYQDQIQGDFWGNTELNIITGEFPA